MLERLDAVGSLIPKAPWSSKKFTEYSSEVDCHQLVSDRPIYSGHSIKRGSVQLYRALCLRDEAIMEIIQMNGYCGITSRRSTVVEVGSRLRAFTVVRSAMSLGVRANKRMGTCPW